MGPGMIFMMLPMIAGSLESIGNVYSSAFCSTATSTVQSCNHNIKELDTVMNYCLRDKDGARDERIKRGLGLVRDRYDKLRSIYDTRSRKWDACYVHVKQLGVCLDDFNTKLQETEAFCQ